MKRRIGTIKGKPIIEGDSNFQTANEIHNEDYISSMNKNFENYNIIITDSTTQVPTTLPFCDFKKFGGGSPTFTWRVVHRGDAITAGYRHTKTPSFFICTLSYSNEVKIVAPESAQLRESFIYPEQYMVPVADENIDDHRYYNTVCQIFECDLVSGKVIAKGIINTYAAQ